MSATSKVRPLSAILADSGRALPEPARTVSHSVPTPWGPVRSDLKASDALVLQSARERSRRTTTPAPVVAYRVHYQVPTDEPGTHHVSDPLWSWEVGAFVRAVLAVPGASLVRNDARPDGVEPLRGWPRNFDAPDPLKKWRSEKAAAERERVMRLVRQVDKDLERARRLNLPNFSPAIDITNFLVNEVPEHLRTVAFEELRHHL